MLGYALGKAFPFVLKLLSLPTQGVVTQRTAWSMTLALVIALARHALLLVQRSLFVLVGWLLFFEEQLDEEAGRVLWQNPLICCMVCPMPSSQPFI